MLKGNSVYLKKEECSGCSACMVSCPQKAISMKADDEGFLYPVIDFGKCVKCGKCQNICPIRSVSPKSVKNILYVGRAANIQLRMNASSGGIIPVLSKYIVKKSGVVFGAAFDKEMHLCHMGIDTIEKLNCLNGSKYLQSDMRHTFQEVKSILDMDRPVLFVGTPCQIEGLNSFLDIKKYGQLITVDLMCHGCPSGKVFHKYCEYRNKIDNGGALTSVNFRDKRTGWKEYSMSFVYENGEYVEKAGQDMYFRGFLRNLFLRPSCYECRFKGEHRVSDITVGDCWDIKLILPDMEDNGGYLWMIAHTSKSQILTILEKEGELELYRVPDGYKIRNEGLQKRSYKNPERKNFFEKLDKFTFDELFERYCSDKFYLKMRRTLARIVRDGKTERMR